MKNKNIFKILVFLSMFFVAVCFATEPNNSVIFTDAQKPIIVKKSHPLFTIILQSNPTTGFSWTLKNFDNSLIKPVKRAYVTTAPRGLMGAGGYEKWTFEAKPESFVVPQTTSITLIYSRSWELEGAQANNFKVVTINDN